MFRKRFHHLAILLTITAFFGIAIWQAGQDALDVDELYEVTLVRQPLFELLRNYRVSSQMPHVLLTKLFATFCDDILCLRLGSVVAGTLSIPLIYLLGQKLGASPAIGTYSAILLSVTAAHLRYSTFIRGYSLMTCLALLSLLLICK